MLKPTKRNWGSRVKLWNISYVINKMVGIGRRLPIKLKKLCTGILESRQRFELSHFKLERISEQSCKTY